MFELALSPVVLFRTVLPVNGLSCQGWTVGSELSFSMNRDSALGVGTTTKLEEFCDGGDTGADGITGACTAGDEKGDDLSDALLGVT